MSRIPTKADVIYFIDVQLLTFIDRTQGEVSNDLLKLMIIDAISTELTVRLPMTFTWKVGCELQHGFGKLIDVHITVEVLSAGVATAVIKRSYIEAKQANAQRG